MNSHDLRLQKEVAWYEPTFQSRHLLNRWPFYSQERNNSAYAVAKKRLMEVALATIPEPENVLVAPCGTFDDYHSIRRVWPSAKLLGIDIAPVPNAIEEVRVGDILHMPLADGSFDVVVANLFFHHIADEGFTDYLKEIRRVLRPHGHLITLEPNCYYPLSLVTRPAKRLFGNITGQVEHEHPIAIQDLVNDCYTSGFSQVETFACTFAHNRIPTPLRVINKLPLPKQLAWLVGLIAS